MDNAVVLDIETKDPHLKDFGCGAIRKDGFIVRLGLFDGRQKWRFSGHEIGPGSLAYNILTDSSITKICHNGVYDLDWIQNGYNIPFRGRCEDTMTRAFLLDAYADHYDLNSCCIRDGIPGKNATDTIQRWWEEHGGKGKAIEHMDEIPTPVVDKYLDQDLQATWDLFHSQAPRITNERLDEANDREVRLYPLLMEMKKNGIKIDWEAREELSNRIVKEYERGMQEIQDQFPYFDSLNSSKQLARMWEELGIEVLTTEKGNPSFSADSMELYEHPMADKITQLRTINTAITKFVDGAIPDYSILGRIHSTFFPALRDEGGTITGRFSSRDPNLQNISAREDKFGPEIRSLFIPEDGCWLGAFDYKQIEYVLFTHYSTGPGSEEARAAIASGMDYHQMVMDMMGWEGKDGRHIAKNLNFGSIYGLGYKSFAKKFRSNIYAKAQAAGQTCQQYAKERMQEYFLKVPFVKPTCYAIQNTAEKRGFVRSIGGRKQRMTPDGKAYKMVNYLIQGSASDVLKEGLVTGWEAGVFDELKMLLTVHDENVFSMDKTRRAVEAAVEFERSMSNVFKEKLSVPIRVDTEIGPNWAACSKDIWKDEALALLVG